MIAAIASVDLENGIGFKNQLLERIPQDLKNFKNLTLNHTVIMGVRTWESLPKKPLPYRKNIVVAREGYDVSNYDNVITMTLDEVKNWLNNPQTSRTEHIFVIGGGFIYKELFSYCDTLYITQIHKHHSDIDTYFPIIKKEEWNLDMISKFHNYNNTLYQFKYYSRKS